MSDDITVSKDVFWLMLLATVRYAMGRRSYVVRETCDLVRAHRVALGPTRMTRLAAEIGQELERAEDRGGFLGDGMDHQEWRRLRVELTAP